MDTNLNFWDDYNDLFLKSLANTNKTWSGPDCEDTFKKVKSNSQQITYDEKDFSYRRNSLGFRSEEFDDTDKVKILYGGCSLTEGVGLPLEHTWQSFLNELISAEIHRPVNMYNVGIGGLSIDAIVRYVYITIKQKKFTPDAVFLLLPSPNRNELLCENRYGDVGMYNFIPNFTGYSDPEIKLFHENVLKTFSPRQRIHDAFQNLLFLQTFLEAKGIPLYFSTWDTFRFEIGKTKKFTTDFSKVLKNYSPLSIRECTIDAPMLFDKDVYNLPFELKFPQNIGRDGMHPGPNAHWNFSKEFFKKLKMKKLFLDLLSKWKEA